MVTIFTNVERQYMMLRQTSEYLHNNQMMSSNIQSYFFDTSVTWSEHHAAAIKASSIVIFLWQGPVYECEVADKALKWLRNQAKIAYAFMSTADSSKNTVSGFTEVEIQQIRDYILLSGSSNYQNLVLWLANKSGQETCEYKLPQELVWQGIYHPKAKDKVLLSTDEYLSEFCPHKRPLVGILFSRESWIWQDTDYIDAVIRELDKRGLDALAIFGLWEDNIHLQAPGISQAVQKFFYLQEHVVISAVINTFKVGLTLSRQNQPGFLRNLNVPILQAYNLLRPQSEWQDGFVGMNPVELSVNVVQPEFDGVIHGGVVSSKESDRYGISRYMSVAERVAALADKAKKWVNLRHKDNAQKKVAIIFHNYPPTNANIGNAAGLDSPVSVVRLLREMANAGYTIDSLPENGQALMDALLAGVTNDRRFLTDEQIAKVVGRVSIDGYKTWFDGLEQSTGEDLIREWGLPPGDVFFADDSLLVPGIMNGNVMITLQPPRGFGEDPAKIIHSPTCPPPHHYFAFYAWIRESWQADAVIHVGTHGSLEWLPGKNAGLSHRCYPELALQDLPNIYPYYVTILGEGIQAKRRGAACLIGHLCPPMSHADTYEELAELEVLLDEYAHYKEEQPDMAARTGEQIEEKLALLHLEEDVPRLPDQSLEEYVLRVHTYLETLKHMQIRVGLHVLGEPPQGDQLTEFILALTRVDNGEVPALPKVIADTYGYDYYQMVEKSGELLPDGSKSYAKLIDEIWELCTSIVVCLQEHCFSEQGIAAVFRLPQITALTFTEKTKAELETVLQYICKELSVKLAATVQEITNTLRALDGQYIEPGPGGAPTNGRADILPTGRNFYGVDPGNLPTPTAWEIGNQLAEQVITRYIAEEGEYPESIGMVFWSDSNMRTNGQCIAELLYLMGVRPVWQRGSRRVIGLEVIEMAELKRPRIDVMARVSGLFRDTLFAAIQVMEKAVALVASLDEPVEMNFVKKHIIQDSEMLEEQGVEKECAWQQASYRIFGCPPGGYGAGVAALLEAKNWENVHDIADVYVRWGAHVYDSGRQGEYLPQLFRQKLGRLDITIKNIDNHEVHLLSSDDFNAYCGGMNAAVRSIRGKAPRCYIGDSTDQSHTEVKSLDEEFRRVLRGESLNPKFIEGMKKHGYKGAADLAALVSHCYDWDATSEVMTDWMYEGLAEKLALDEAMQKWMQAVNPWALQRIAEKLLEAQRRGMWDAKPETKEQLEQLYLSIEGELEERADS